MSDSVDEGIFGALGAASDDLALAEMDSDKVVSARGTEDGLVLRIDGGAPWGSVLSELESFLDIRRITFCCPGKIIFYSYTPITGAGICELITICQGTITGRNGKSST